MGGSSTATMKMNKKYNDIWLHFTASFSQNRFRLMLPLNNKLTLIHKVNLLNYWARKRDLGFLFRRYRCLPCTPVSTIHPIRTCWMCCCFFITPHMNKIHFRSSVPTGCVRKHRVQVKSAWILYLIKQISVPTQSPSFPLFPHISTEV